MGNNQMKITYLAALLYALIIGFSFIFVKLALTASNPMDTLAHRFTISFIAASLPVLCGWIRIDIKFKQIVSIIPLALLYPALFFAFQAYGLVYTTTSEAGIIQATAPIFTMILAAVYLKERSSTAQKLSVLLSVLGVIFIFYMGNATLHLETANAKGTLLILLSTLSISGYLVLTRTMVQKVKLAELTYIMTAIGFLFFNGVSLFNHLSANTLNQYFQPFTNQTFVISILYLGLLSSLLTSYLSNYVLSQIHASKMSVFNNFSTLVTLIGGWLFLNEQLAYYHLIGAIMIIAGILGVNFLGTAQKIK